MFCSLLRFKRSLFWIVWGKAAFLFINLEILVWKYLSQRIKVEFCFLCPVKITTTAFSCIDVRPAVCWSMALSTFCCLKTEMRISDHTSVWDQHAQRLSTFVIYTHCGHENDNRVGLKLTMTLWPLYDRVDNRAIDICSILLCRSDAIKEKKPDIQQSQKKEKKRKKKKKKHFTSIFFLLDGCWAVCVNWTELNWLRKNGQECDICQYVIKVRR